MPIEIKPEPHDAFHRYVRLPLGRAIAAFLLFILGPTRVKGKGHVPREGGLLILANHISDIDPVMLQYASPLPIHFMAKSELYEMKGLGKIISKYKAFPDKRGEPDRAAIKHAVALLKIGEVVAIFPEGQLSEDGQLQELKPGVTLLARMAQTPVICCGLKNTDCIMPYGKTTPRPAFTWVEAKWSDPQTFKADITPEEFLAWAERQLRELTDQ